MRTPTPSQPEASTPTLIPLGVRTPEAITITPIQGVTTPEAVTQTAAIVLLPTPTPLAPTPLPTIALIPLVVPSNPNTRGFALSSNNGAVTGSGFDLPFSATTFARDPVDPSHYAVVDVRGLIYLFFGGVSGQDVIRVHVSPFLDFEPQSAQDNQANVVQVVWSPDGQHLAFLVDANRDDRDGVWLLNNPQSASVSSGQQIFRECPPPIDNDCSVNIGGEPKHYNSLHIDWNSSSTAILVQLDLSDENRRAFTVVPLDNDPTHLPPIYRYEYASWSQDGTRVLVSGAGPDGRQVIGWLNPADGTVQMLIDGSSAGLIFRDAVQRPDGQIVALASPSLNSPFALYDSSGRPLGGVIGDAAPARVSWSPDRSAALVAVNDGALRYYVANVDGSVQEITASVAGALAVDWVGGDLPPTSDTSAPPTNAPTITPTLAPTNAQSQFGLGVNQSVQIIAPSGANLRATASQSAQVVELLKFHDFVTLIDGPVQSEGLLWWKARAGDGQIGWVAEASADGTQLLTNQPQ